MSLLLCIPLWVCVRRRSALDEAFWLAENVSSCSCAGPSNLFGTGDGLGILGRMERRESHRLRLLAVVLPVALSGCFSYQEEIWIDRDGSGRAEVDLFVADPSQKLRDFMESSGQELGRPEMELPEWTMPEGLLPTERQMRMEMGEKLESWEVIQKRGIRIRIAYRFDPGDAYESDAAPDAHEFEWESDGWFRHRFTRTIEGQKGLGLPNLPPGVLSELGRGDRPGFRYRSTVHFPGEISESNASSTEGETAVWDLSILDLVSGGRRLEATVDSGWALRRLLTIGGGILCGGFLLFCVGTIALVLLRGKRTYPGR